MHKPRTNLHEWRLDKVQEYVSFGKTQQEIADILKVDQSTISRDITYLRQRARENLSQYVTTTLPEEMELSLVRLNSMIRELHKDLEDTNSTKRDKHNAISLINECTSLRLEILGAGVLNHQLLTKQQQSSTTISF